MIEEDWLAGRKKGPRLIGYDDGTGWTSVPPAEVPLGFADLAGLSAPGRGGAVGTAKHPGDAWQGENAASPGNSAGITNIALKRGYVNSDELWSLRKRPGRTKHSLAMGGVQLLCLDGIIGTGGSGELRSPEDHFLALPDGRLLPQYIDLDGRVYPPALSAQGVLRNLVGWQGSGLCSGLQSSR